MFEPPQGKKQSVSGEWSNTANDSIVKVSQLVKSWCSRLWRRNSCGEWEVSITLGESVLLHRLSRNPATDFYIRKSKDTVMVILLRGPRVINVILQVSVLSVLFGFMSPHQSRSPHAGC